MIVRIDEVMRRVHGRWDQLIANHEARWLGRPDFGGSYGRYDLQDL